MSFREKVRNYASELALDEQASGLLCPACFGGLSSERSFSVIRHASRAEYKCHRAGCDFAGNVNMIGRPLLTSVHSNIKPPRQDYGARLIKVPDDVIERVADVVSLGDINMQAIMWAPDWDKGRLAIPIRNRFHNRIGYQFRALDKGTKPKTINRLIEIDTPCMSWYRWDKDVFSNWSEGVDLLLVEDIFSAIKAARYMHCIALLGTHLSPDKLTHIMRIKPRSVTIALDEDATAKSAGLVGRLDGLLNNVRMLPLKKDLKNCTLEEVKDVLKPAVGN